MKNISISNLFERIESFEPEFIVNMKTCSFIILFVTFLTYSNGDAICGVGGRMDTCPSTCKPVPTCSDPSPDPLPPGTLCPAVCGPPRCSCKSNYVLDNGVCIPVGDCKDTK